MRRLAGIGLAAVMLLSLFSCAPHSVLTANEPNDSTVSADEKQPEPTQTVAEDTQSVQSAQAKTEEQLTEGALYLKNKKRNDHIRPSFDIDSAGICDFKTPQLSGVTLSFFVGETSAFSAGSMTQTQWFDALAKEYGLTLQYKLRSDATLYSSQLIAQKAGKTVDIVTADIADSAACMSLMSSVQDEVNVTQSCPVSKRIFDLSGGKLFSGKGNAAVLWYNTSLTGTYSPFELFTKNEWRTDKLQAIMTDMNVSHTRLIECNSWLSFGSAGTVQASGLTDTGYTMAYTDESVIETNEAFGSIFNKDNAVADGDFSFKAGSAVFKYAMTPEKGDFELSWAPIPAYTESGRNVGTLCGRAMGLSKTVDDSRRAPALAFMALWCARYSESRSDALVFDLKLSPKLADSYLTFCEEQGGLYCVDSIVYEQFTAEKMPTSLYGSPDTIYNTFGVAYNRTDVLNDRDR